LRSQRGIVRQIGFSLRAVTSRLGVVGELTGALDRGRRLVALEIGALRGLGGLIGAEFCGVRRGFGLSLGGGGRVGRYDRIECGHKGVYGLILRFLSGKMVSRAMRLRSVWCAMSGELRRGG
jgi:hypothetical protein